jgi:AcrR family transcriptional regulator
MPLPRFHKLPADKRRSILDAATAEFAAHGFEDASLNQIIAGAGISKGAMYYYFADKADLYGAVLDDVLDRVAATVADLPEPDDAQAFWSTLSAGLARLGQTFFADPELAALARGLYHGGGGPVYERLLARSASWIQALLVRGQTLGAVRDDLPRDLLSEAVTGLLVAIDRWFADAFTRYTPAELMPLMSKVVPLLRDLLEPGRARDQRGDRDETETRRAAQLAPIDDERTKP